MPQTLAKPWKQSSLCPFPALYARTNTGAVQCWSIEVRDNQYRTVAGQLDGVKTTSEWTVATPKNAGRKNGTTPSQQALAEARSRWQKKVDAGYREDITRIDDVMHIEPMLAKKYEDYKAGFVFPLFCQPKLDGIRCIARKEGLFSRNGKQFYPWPHIMQALAPVWAKYPGAIFDGEAYVHDLHDDFNEIVSLVKKTKPTPADIEKVAVSLQYHVYDLPSEATLPFGARSRELLSLLSPLLRLPPVGPIVFVPTMKVGNQALLDIYMENWVAAGYEGQMVRLDAPYEFKRSANLLKRKEFVTEEFVIQPGGVTEGKGNKTGWAASMTFKMPSGKSFNSNVKGNEAYLKDLWKNRELLVGKTATVRYFNLTPDGVPRFPYVVAIDRESVEGAVR